MAYYTDISNSSYSAKDTALYNRMNGVENHNPWGLFIAGNAGNILNTGISLFNNYNSNSDYIGEEPEIDLTDTNTRSNNIANFTSAMKAFGANPSKENAAAFKKAYEEDPQNPTIKRYWANYKTKVEQALS